MRLIFVILVCVLIGCALLVFLVGPQVGEMLGGMHSSDNATPVRMEPAKIQPLVQTVSAPGELEPLTKVDISAEVSARIESLPLRDNDRVRKGDLLVKLDDRELRVSRQSAVARRDGEKSRLDSEHARLEGLLSSLTFARRDLKRQQDLLTSGDVSQKAVDDAQQRVDDLESSVQATQHSISVLESSVTAAEAEIERTDEALKRTEIHSPIDGVITALNAEIGELVVVGTMNNAGTVIMTVADLSRMILNARVAETDVTKVQPGQTAKIHLNAYPDEVFEGRVRRVSLQRTTAQMQDTSYFLVEVDVLPLDDRTLLSGLAANVDIEIATHEGVVVPSQAIVDRLLDKIPAGIINDNDIVDRTMTSQTVVYRVVDGQTICTPVRPGPSDLTHTLVLAGLAEGETVVVGPFKELAELHHKQSVREADDAELATDESPSSQSGGGGVRIRMRH